MSGLWCAGLVLPLHRPGWLGYSCQQLYEPQSGARMIAHSCQATEGSTVPRRSKGGAWTPERVAALRSGYARGDSLATIASRLSTTARAVAQMAHELGISKEAGRRSRITREEGGLVRGLVEQGKNVKEIADALGINSNRVRRIGKAHGVEFNGRWGARTVQGG